MREAREFLRFLWGEARWPVVAAVGLSVVLSLTEGVSLGIVFPLVAVLGGGGGGGPVGGRTGWLLGVLAGSHVPRTWWLPALLVLVLVSVGLLAQLNGMLSALTIGIVLRVRARLAARIYEAILHADWMFLTTRRTSDLTHALTTELNRVGQLAGSAMAVVANGLVGLLLLGVAGWLAPGLTATVLVFFGLMAPWQRRVGRAIYRSGEEVSGRMRAVFDSSMERLGNLKVVKAYGAQEAELGLFTRRYEAVVRETMENEWRGTRASRWFQLATMGLLCGVILVGLGWLRLGAGTMLLFLFAFVRAMPRLNTVQAKGNECLADLPAYGQIVAFLAERAGHTEREGKESAPRLEWELALRAVRFRYGSGPLVLDGVSLELAAGRVTAIAGLSGAGKSTVADLVMGLLLPEAGVVAVDGVAITRENARAWRRQVGYVSQDTLLFHASVRENLLWAKPEATEEELVEAIAGARAEFVWGPARGMETMVGDRGMMLSHGQRQRIALARALLLKPKLLILDEATNSLDLENEERILEAVRGLGVTVLLISHRPSAVRVADRVYVLEGGRVRARGAWEEVRRFVEAQERVEGWG